MREIVIKSYGKVNLGLDVLYKREDGYHEISTVMQQIDLSDTVTIRENGGSILLESDCQELPLDSTNLVYRAWKAIQERTGLDRGVQIKIEKNIPLSAGLAGGSSNAAVVLKGLNELWDLGLDQGELIEIGRSIGADVPFCITGGTAWAEGIGEKLTRLRPFRGKDLLLINPGTRVSTAQVYSSINGGDGKRIDMGKIISSIEEDDIRGVAANMENIMEGVVMEKLPIISHIKNDMLRYGALASLMSGSGPTVFGLFDDRDKLEYSVKKLKGKYPTVLLAKTI
ncbi:MAG: 4-(cytidine 5'-diphospho)-2-C-methyl-D-erythritol kinase [Tissierellaceae bacterium]